ncbi:TPA: Ail/Lom family outer membrane beta-barrel protein [Klebsiella oxytoca]|uniref:Ail/Lom family outer membrane beta-barrel protein n=1 Tax=Klebsiella oxytoca TaxID=571 RepID=A0AAN5LBI6_KLEOX|nr:Ail/Lom family outer membrane beta-barrel protein [Klebsiella oxytoca]
MKKLAVVIILAGAGIMSCGIGMADAAEQLQSTASVGYAYSHIKDFGNLNGLNLSYRYEFTPEWGVIGSFSWLTGKDNFQEGAGEDANRYHDSVDEYSLLAGPAYRINDYVSLYGQVGVAWARFKEHSHYADDSSDDFSANKAAFAYGAGVQFNPVENIAVSVGYEGASYHAGSGVGSISPNGFNIGVGYRF